MKVLNPTKINFPLLVENKEDYKKALKLLKLHNYRHPGGRRFFKGDPFRIYETLPNEVYNEKYVCFEYI